MITPPLTPVKFKVKCPAKPKKPPRKIPNNTAEVIMPANLLSQITYTPPTII